MTMSSDDGNALETLEARLRAILPEEYQDCYENVQPVSMGSAGLKYGSDGQVAWNEMWASFCDLAMAGGPPHKGTLLEPARRSEIDAQPDRYAQVIEEVCRGIVMVTDLAARESSISGWVRVPCFSEAMAGWLARAIVMENVAARCEGMMLDLPAAPHFRLEKEIKNVVTVSAKTCHYWIGHIPRAQKRAIADLFAKMAEESPLVVPAVASDDDGRAESLRIASASMGETIQRNTGLSLSSHRYAGWLGVECASVHAAIWMMRALVVSNILSRREGTVLFVPVNPVSDPQGETVVRSVTRIRGFAVARGIL